MDDKKNYIQIPMEERLYNRAYCKQLALELLNKGHIKGMTPSQLYCEIFAHAYVFFNFNRIPKILRQKEIFKSIYRSASDGVDLEDNGDTNIRKIAYRIFWIMPALPIKRNNEMSFYDNNKTSL